jgi:Flp pilus assembly protein TadG
MKKSQAGLAALEFAIVLPVLILILFGIIEFGLLLFNKQVITNASREGARSGIVNQFPRMSNTEIASIVNSYCQDYLVSFGSTSSPSVSISRTGTEFQDDLIVTVSYQYDFLVLPDLPYLSLPGQINLSAHTVMKYE